MTKKMFNLFDFYYHHGRYESFSLGMMKISC